jgi:hypothetical protein
MAKLYPPFFSRGVMRLASGDLLIWVVVLASLPMCPMAPSVPLETSTEITGKNYSTPLKTPSLTIYDTRQFPLRNITNQLFPNGFPTGLSNIKDVAIADFNGDTFQDIYITQQGTSTSGYRRDSNNSGRAILTVSRESEGLNLKTTGATKFNFQDDPTLDLPPFMLRTTITAADIRIGATGFNPRD